MSVEERGSHPAGDGANSFDWWSDSEVVQCQGCKAVTFRQTSSDSESGDFGDEGWEPSVKERLYPGRLAGMKTLGDEVEYYVPTEVYRIYSETIGALANGSPVLAGIGLRALLEAVCKERHAGGKDLHKKIEDLQRQGILTQVSATILHKIRALGNAAAHEVKPHPEHQLALALGIVEHLLNDVYILPKKAEHGFPEDKSNAKPNAPVAVPESGRPPSALPTLGPAT